MNGDLIFRSALLADIEESVVFSVKNGQPSAEIRGANKITDRIKAAAAVDAATRWISVEEDKPKDFVSVLGHMTDAGDFPSVRECYLIDGQHFFFPALNAVHPVDKWMDMPEV